MNITVIARAKAKSGMEGKVKEELLNLAELTRTEPGCTSYEIHQASDDGSMFLTHEVWESKAAIESHMNQPYLTELFSRAEELFDGPVEIKLWQKISP